MVCLTYAASEMNPLRTPTNRMIKGDEMQLELNDEQAAELRQILDSVLGDMSSEIADTDNVSYRELLNARRDNARAIRDKLA